MAHDEADALGYDTNDTLPCRGRFIAIDRTGHVWNDEIYIYKVANR